LPFSHESILAITGLVGKNYKIIQAEKNTLSVILGDGGPIKLSFFGGLGFGRVGVPEEIADNGMKLASLEDLFGHKLKGLLQRVEAKDYMDLVALLLNGLKLKDGIEAALGLFGNVFSPMEALKAMVYFKGGDLEQLTKAQRQILIASHKDLPNFFTAKKVLSSSLV